MNMQDRITKWDVFWARFDAGFCYVAVGFFFTYHVACWVVHFPATPISAVIIAVVSFYVIKSSRRTLDKFKTQTQDLSDHSTLTVTD